VYVVGVKIQNGTAATF